jgi:hypothetical protein
MNSWIKYMLEKQSSQDCEERGGLVSEHGYTTIIDYVESFELLTLELSMAIDTDDHEEIKRCQSEMITLCTVHNYDRC